MAVLKALALLALFSPVPISVAGLKLSVSDASFSFSPSSLSPFASFDDDARGISRRIREAALFNFFPFFSSQKYVYLSTVLGLLKKLLKVNLEEEEEEEEEEEVVVDA